MSAIEVDPGSLTAAAGRAHAAVAAVAVVAPSGAFRSAGLAVAGAHLAEVCATSAGAWERAVVALKEGVESHADALSEAIVTYESTERAVTAGAALDERAR